MVETSLSDGMRIAQLLASDLVGHEGRLAGVTVTDADPDVEPTTDGRRAYAVSADGEPLATAFVHPERVRLDFRVAPEAVVEAATDVGLRRRPKAVEPPQSIVFVENGAEVKRALAVVEAAVTSR
ncbi:hypothetical protein [Haloplanus pelagicus]|jgi:hypothetical protein|uniref:hypothetical protein n=1 Tax=Haloplanus pelagicus TaxID=2949995 RepID=UPI00203D3734|nr:hypothetical protein [Haloplanus sp. HW8-1]